MVVKCGEKTCFFSLFKKKKKRKINFHFHFQFYIRFSQRFLLIFSFFNHRINVPISEFFFTGTFTIPFFMIIISTRVCKNARNDFQFRFKNLSSLHAFQSNAEIARANNEEKRIDNLTFKIFEFEICKGKTSFFRI